MPGVILAFLARPEAAEALLSAARQLQSLTSAQRLNVLAVRRPPVETIIPSEEVLTPRREARVRERERQRVEQLKAVFDRWAINFAKPSAVIEWFDVESGAATALQEYGSRSDVIVLKRPQDRDSEPERQALHAALFEAERPVLVIPAEAPPAPFGRRVLVAWRNDQRTLKAVLAALRFLGAAERIDVVEGVRAGAPKAYLPEIFEEHGRKATHHVLPLPREGGFGAALLAKAEELGSDILVMAAFAHNPLHNLVFGGVTRHMLAHATLPVLMRH